MKNIDLLFKVFESEGQTIPAKDDQEKCFLYMADELVTMILNQRNQSVLEVLTKLVKDLVKKYRFSFSNLLVLAEKNNQPKRLELLKQLWYDGLQ